MDGHDTRGQFDPAVHGFNGMVSTSLPETSWQIITSNVSEVSKDLPSTFPFVKDMNSGRPLGLGKCTWIRFMDEDLIFGLYRRVASNYHRERRKEQFRNCLPFK